MNRSILRFSAALASGLVFGLGLSLSGMLNPARVQAFLDVFGNWDPSLAFVLGGAVLVAFIGVRAAQRMGHPYWTIRSTCRQTRRSMRRSSSAQRFSVSAGGSAVFAPARLSHLSR